eukprot:3257222-Pyramimonas_sp.AAC.1
MTSAGVERRGSSRPSIPRGLPPNFVVSAELQIIDMMAKFLIDRIATRGLLRVGGSFFFDACVNGETLTFVS